MPKSQQEDQASQEFPKCTALLLKSEMVEEPVSFDLRDVIVVRYKKYDVEREKKWLSNPDTDLSYLEGKASISFAFGRELVETFLLPVEKCEYYVQWHHHLMKQRKG